MFKLNFDENCTLGYIRGHLNPFWNPKDYQKLPYKREKIKLRNELEQWAKAGYPKNTRYEGLMYDNKNPMPKFVDRFKDIFVNIENLTYTFYKMRTMTVMPEHVDHFSTYKKIFNVPNEKVVRILVMLEDWLPGHYLEINGKAIVDWKAGDFFVWKHNVPHAASNIGKNVHPRYTLQITATLKDDDMYQVANKLYSFNVTGGDWIIDSPLIERIRQVTNDNNGLPYMIYLGNGEISELRNMKVNPYTIEDLNFTGLDIYLYEPLCSYNYWTTEYMPGGTKHSEWFYSEIPHDLNPDFLRSDELDSILEFSENNNLHSIRVHTCDYDVEKHYPFYNKKLGLMYDDVFVKTRYFRNILDPEFRESTPTKKFISLNYRYTFNRHLTCAFLSGRNANIAWPYQCEFEHVKKGPYYDLDKPLWDNHREHLIKGINQLNQDSPLVLDFEFKEPTVIEHHYFKTRFPNNQIISNVDFFGIEKFYKESFCEIVCESRFAQPTANYSEKTFDPIFYYRPFILLAPPYTLKALREHGFKTFGEFWDESYDEIEDHEERLNKVFTLISDIDILSMDSCNTLYQKMIPILEYNHRVLRTKLRP